jgi:tRNA threonylcarbamoyladenosine modification (KEOPS) complex Cgi121 subunit
MAKGPRGGGRDRDQIVRHTLASEQDWAKKLGLPPAQDAMLTDEELHAHRDAYCHAIRALHAEGKMARTWPLRFLIRHTAFHTMDHAWETEDKNLSSASGV